MTRLFPRICFLMFLAVICGCLPIGGFQAVAQSPMTIDPGLSGLHVRDALFVTQSNLAAGDVAGATESINSVADEVDTLASAFVSDPTVGSELRAAYQLAVNAVAKGDGPGLAVAKGTIWTSLLRGSFAETLVATAAKQPDAAASWLLLRDFRTTTRFVRPGSGATIAIQQLKNGEISPELATEAVRADLLDTYQGLLDADLNQVSGSESNSNQFTIAENAALAHGYWLILRPSFVDQQGADAAVAADASFIALVAASVSGDASQVGTTVAPVVEIVRSFRAAPLTQAEQQRRAGQLTLYLSLVPIEYGRGVSKGEVILDLEIAEAQAFLDGARASFDDLRLILQEKDPAATTSIDQTLQQLDVQLRDAAAHTNVAPEGEIKSSVDGLIDKVTSLFPDEWTRAGGDADFDVIDSVLDNMVTAARTGNWEQAESARLEAYAIYEMGAEKRLLAFAPDLATKTEQLFWQGTGKVGGLATAIQSHASVSEIKEIRGELDTALEESRERLGTGRPATAVVVFNAATIVFREGLEAILILASLVASMIGANTKFKKPLIIGAVGAFIATGILFILTRSVLASLSRYGEKVEAVVSVIAIAVLLLVMNWFFHKVYWTKWIGKHHAKRRMLVGGAAGQMLGLVVLGFTSVFREGAETVLFLQALVLDAGTLVVIEGTLLGLVGVAIVGAMVLVLQQKLPHKKMLMVTGVMIALVLVIMVGNTIHVLQVVGWAPISVVLGLTVSYWMGIWFGVFATWEGLIMQGIGMIVVIGSYFVAELKNTREMKVALRELAPSA